jgi:hypothetical protein
MALKFIKPKPASAAAGETHSAPPKKAATKTTGTVIWMKKGAAAKDALHAAEAEAGLRKAEAGRMFRFRMPEGEQRTITFLDGKLDADGMLDIPMFNEHTIRLNGNWANFVCTAESDQTQPCPICEKGDRSALVGVMTVIDHTPHTIKNGPKQGQVVQNTRKLFVAKLQTLKQLTMLSQKRGGLTGCTFDVSRVGDTSAAVGSVFDFQHKHGTRQEIMDKFGLTEEDVMPADYGAEIRYLTPQELIELGAGKALTGIGNSNGTSPASKSNLTDEL